MYIPFWTECFDMLAMVLGQGHRRALRNGAGQGGDMADWERLTEDCQEIDSSQLFLAIKDLTDQGCNSPALANECSDGWVLAASNVCFSAGGSDVSGHQSCTTTAGTAPEGSSCYFPFVWSQDGGESFDTFNECTPLANSGTPWCSTGPNYALAPDGSDCAAEGTCKWGNCVCEESDSHYGSFNLPRPTPGVRLVHKSGGVSCNRGRGFLSPWGCDLEEDSELGTFITTDCQHGCDTSHIVAPPASRAGGGWWYRPYDENWGNADQLTFQEDHDQEHPQGNFAAGNYQVRSVFFSPPASEKAPDLCRRRSGMARIWMRQARRRRTTPAPRASTCTTSSPPRPTASAAWTF